MTISSVETPDWSSIPAPEDDGAADHLIGLMLPSCPLASTAGGTIDLSTVSGRVVVYAYPRTGQPGIPNPNGWDMIPGARGCTPQSCAFRDHARDLAELGVGHIFGLSTQSQEYQREAAVRLHLPFALLSDADLKFCNLIGIPTFEVSGMTLTKRITFIIDDGVIVKTFYPVFPPDTNASVVIHWLAASR